MADEVRGLASRTQKSTSEIQRTIDELQASMRTAVQTMQSSLHRADSSVQSAQSASGALRDIIARVQDISEMSTQIATAVEQQGIFSEEVSRSVTRIRDAATSGIIAAIDNRDNVEQVAAMSEALSQLARQFWAKRR